MTQDTLCPVDGPYGHTAFLIDRTDTYSKIQIAQIKKHLEQIQLNLPKYSELSIYDIKDNPASSSNAPPLTIQTVSLPIKVCSAFLPS